MQVHAWCMLNFHLRSGPIQKGSNCVEKYFCWPRACAALPSPLLTLLHRTNRKTQFNDENLFDDAKICADRKMRSSIWFFGLDGDGGDFGAKIVPHA